MQETATAAASAPMPPDPALARRAWLMAWMAMLGTMCCSTSVVLVNVGVFMRPLSHAFEWSRGDIAAALSIAAVSMALANPLVGRLIDRFGVRPVLIGSLIAYGLSTAAIPWLVGHFQLPGLFLGYALLAATGAGSNVIAYVRLLSGWFSGAMDHSRGLALGLSSSGLALGGAVSGPFGVLLIEHYGWQAGYWGLALLPLLVGLPIAVFGIRMAPDEGTAPAAAHENPLPDVPGMSLRETMRTRHFWVLMAIALLMSAAIQGVGIHIAPLLSDLKLKPDYLAILLGFHGVLGLCARLGAGFFYDRFFAPYVSVAIFALGAIASFALAGIPGLAIAIVATTMFPIASGAESDFVGYVVGKYYGLKCYGQIFGLIYGMFMIGVAFGPLLFGVAYDAWGNYRVPFLIAGLGLAAICGLLLALPRFPADERSPINRRHVAGS